MSSAATVARALLYLRVTSVVGLVRSRLARLRQPKYLAGALVGAAYVYFTFIRRLLVSHPRYGAGAPGLTSPDLATLFSELGALVLLVVIVLNWTLPRSASLAFSEAEIAFLFPAPVSRRLLVHFRLLSAQLSIVSTALIFTVIFGRRSVFGGNLWFHAIGWWLILATVNLHFMGTSFVYSRFLNRSLTSGWGKAASVGAIWLVIGALFVGVCSTTQMPQQSDFASTHDFANYVAAQLHRGPLAGLLAIPELVVAPYFAGSGLRFLEAVGPVIVILVIHYFWVLNTEVAFEEASIARAEKRAKRRRAVSQGDWRGQSAARKAQKPPFRLADQGRPELAFLWKNLLSASAMFRPKVAATISVVILVGSQWLLAQPALEGARLFALMMFSMLLGFTLVLGPMMARQDLRTELSNIDLLKSYPLRGWQIVMGELLTPLSILSAIIWICLLAGVLLLNADHMPWLTPLRRLGAALAAAIIAPPLVAIQLLVTNAATVLLPAWSQAVANRGERGVEVMGQRVIFVVGQMLITALALVPAVIGAALVFFAAFWLAGILTGAVAAALMLFGVLCAEAGIGVLWLGSRFEHFDISAELQG